MQNRSDSQHITVESLTDADAAGAIELIEAQAARLHALDPRLRPPQSDEHIAATIAEQRNSEGSPPLVARDVDRKVCGYVLPDVREITPEADIEMLAFYPARNGVLRDLTLPPPDDPRARAVLDALLDRAEESWSRMQTDAEVFTQSSCDLWMEPSLLARGFWPDGLRARLARPGDEEVLVGLYLAELPPSLQALSQGVPRAGNGVPREAGPPLVWKELRRRSAAGHRRRKGRQGRRDGGELHKRVGRGLRTSALWPLRLPQQRGRARRHARERCGAGVDAGHARRLFRQADPRLLPVFRVEQPHLQPVLASSRVQTASDHLPAEA